MDRIELLQRALEVLDYVGVSDLSTEDYEEAKEVRMALRAALREPESGPVAYRCKVIMQGHRWEWNYGTWLQPSHGYEPLYTMPQRDPLTDQQIDNLILPTSGTATIRDMVRVIEAAHGI